MSGIKELLRVEADGAISFGDYELEEKKKKQERKLRRKRPARLLTLWSSISPGQVSSM